MSNPKSAFNFHYASGTHCNGCDCDGKVVQLARVSTSPNTEYWLCRDCLKEYIKQGTIVHPAPMLQPIEGIASTIEGIKELLDELTRAEQNIIDIKNRIVRSIAERKA